ncbi:MAG: imidazolonepropionase, partial [Rhodothermales bacterium]
MTNISELITCRGEGGQGDLHPIPDAAMAWKGGAIEWVGPREHLPAAFSTEEVIDAGRALLVPGLVDCHTHLAF